MMLLQRHVNRLVRPAVMGLAPSMPAVTASVIPCGRYTATALPVSSASRSQNRRDNAWGRSAYFTAAAGTAAAFLSAATATTASCDDEAPTEKKMYYRMLGNTGLKVSVLSYGFWATFGSKSDLQKDAEGGTDSVHSGVQS